MSSCVIIFIELTHVFNILCFRNVMSIDTPWFLRFIAGLLFIFLLRLGKHEGLHTYSDSQMLIFFFFFSLAVDRKLF